MRNRRCEEKSRKNHPGSVRWIFSLIALIVAYVGVFAQQSAADCWEDPWICDELDIGCLHPGWMDSLDGALLISEVSIPGTHQTMASQSGQEVGAICQSVQDLRKQLDAGIRAVDIRCRHLYDRFAIHHAAYYQEAYFGEPLNIPGHENYGDQNIMQKCVQFLYENPSEFILMRVAQTHTVEECSRAFAETFEWYREDDGCYITAASGDSAVNYRDYIWTAGDCFLDGYPTIDEIRGKIVIFQAFATRYQVGNAPRRVIAADLDGNGYSDIVTVNVDDDNVAVLLNRGDGTFEKKHFYTGGGPRDVCAVDLNSDGWLDLAVVKFNNPGHNYMAVHFNRGDGTGSFHDFVDYYVEDDPVAITSTDINRDGLPDLVIAGQASSEITLMINRNDAPGSFNRLDRYCGGGPRDLVSADFNGDGWPDLAVVKYNNPGHNYMAVFLHNGLGWEDFVDYYVEDDPVAITVTDINRDDLPDLVIAGQASSEITLMVNRSDSPGTFERLDRYCGGGPRDLVSADFNNDGWLDLAVVKYNNPGHNYMAVFLHNGVDTWHDFVDYYTGDDPYGICAADLNLDGNYDLITSAISERCVEVFDGDGSGTFYSAHYGFPWSECNEQNDYTVHCLSSSFDSKWTKIRNQIDEALSGDPGELYINFTSGSEGPLCWPWVIAAGSAIHGQGMNRRTYDYLNSLLLTGRGRCGVIMTDFPGPGLIQAVIDHNDLVPISVDHDVSAAFPLSFEIHQNYPNPFALQTSIQYGTPQKTELSIKVYDSSGRMVGTLAEGYVEAGYHRLVWKGDDSEGRQLPSGAYFIQMESEGFESVRKVVLVR